MAKFKTPPDLSYRPTSYFWPITYEAHTLNAIKGDLRRTAIRQAFEAGRLDGVDDYYSAPTLQHEDRQALGAIHPSLMGGEYLPDPNPTEIEIARIRIASTTWDVVSVYARPGKSRIHYQVVDEYDGDTLEAKRARTSIRPLSLGQLVDFMLGAWSLQDVCEMNELDRSGVQAFTHPSSQFYPQFEAALRARIDEWYA